MLILTERIDLAQHKLRNYPSRGYIGASVIGSPCQRALWYAFRSAKDSSFPSRILRRFETGHAYEARVIEWLREAEYEVRCENSRARNPKKQFAAEELGGVFRGHVDGFVRGHELEDWHLLEVKAMVSAKYQQDEYGNPSKNKSTGTLEGRWWRTKRLGCKEAQPTHYAQLQAYMGFSQTHYEKWKLDAPLTRALYLCVNTDTDQVYAEQIEYEPGWYRRIKERVREIVRAQEPPKRLHENPEAFDCRYCGLRDICHRNDPVRRECRTCEHAVCRLPGDRRYFADRWQWICEENRSSCGDYTACDKWTQITETPDF